VELRGGGEGHQTNGRLLDHQVAGRPYSINPDRTDRNSEKEIKEERNRKVIAAYRS
jgi:hypothetical protein